MVLMIPVNMDLEIPLFNKSDGSGQGRPKDERELLIRKCGAEQTALG